MSLLKSLKFIAQPADDVKAMVEARTWLIDRLEEQKRLASDQSYTRKVSKWTGKGPDRKVVELVQKVTPWWQFDQTGSYVLTVRFGRKLIEFEKGKPGIAVPSPDKLSSTIDTLITAVRNGELDQHLVKPQAKPASPSAARRPA
jgi:hypothetical protein